MQDMLPVKVKFANLHLNRLLSSSGKVTELDIYSVVTRNMRESGRLVLIDAEELLNLTRENGFVEFVKLKEVA